MGTIKALAAAGILTTMGAMAAQAATLTLVPGTAVAWNTGNYKAACTGSDDTTCYNPNGTAPSGLDLTAFDGNTNFAAIPQPGLFINSAARITVEFLGKEAGALNTAFSFAGGSITNADANLGGSFFAIVGSGMLDFAFSSSTGSSAPNGGPITGDAAIAFSDVSADGKSVYAFFDDNGGGIDRDYDDMVVRISVAAVPLPAGLLLLGTGLAGLGAVRRLRKS